MGTFNVPKTFYVDTACVTCTQIPVAEASHRAEPQVIWPVSRACRIRRPE